MKKKCKLLCFLRGGLLRTSLREKLLAVLMFASFNVFAADGYDQTTKFSFELNGVTIKAVFQKIEESSEFKVLYNEKTLDVNRHVNVNVKDENVESILDQLFKGSKNAYQVYDKQIVITESKDSPSIQKSKSGKSQKKEITGVVKDTEGETLPGVTVLVKGTNIGTSTDLNGKFEITVSADENVLVFSFVGMNSQEVKIGDQTVISVILDEKSIGLGEIVAIGYGTQKKRNVTGAVQSIKSDELLNLPVAQIGQKLQGKTSGVEILQTTGIPGQGMAIRVRGSASINASNQPLYVVDGFPIVGDISNINPDEIESLSILKDASATSLYGSRASNGVVLIQTKMGQLGKTQISLNGYYGIQSVPQKGRPDMMNAREFAQFEKEIREEYAAYKGTVATIPEEYQNPEQYGKGTDWYNLLLRDAPIQNYNLTISSNKDRLRTTVVGGYMNQDGVLKNSNFSRFSLRVNTEYRLSDRVKFGLNVAPTYSKTLTPKSDGSLWSSGILESAILSSPIAKAVNDDGTLPLTATGAGMFPNPNWLRVVDEVKNNTNDTRLLSNAYIDFEVIKDLHFKSSANVDMDNKQLQYFSPSTSGSVYAVPPQKTKGSVTTTSYLSWLTENTLTYSKTFNDHQIDALLGYTAQKYRYDYSYLYGTTFPDDQVTTLNAAATITGSSLAEEWALLSWVSRLNYNYKDKYLLSLAMRRDGSSRFGKDNRWGNFPSVSAGWILSDEKFLSSMPKISYLKVRASYGLTGNNNIGNYSHFAAVNTDNYAFNGVLASGKTTTSLSNTELGWEKSDQFDAGIDIGLLKDRIFFQYDYFNKTTSDMLYSVSVPQESGFSSFTTNTGKFQFWGHEFVLSTKNMIKTFKWNTDLNISFVKNKVLDLGDGIDHIGGLTGDPFITKVGEPIGQFCGYVFDGIYNNQEELDASPKHATSTVGTVRMKDTNNDKVIDDYDRTVIGNPAPKFTYGITNDFSYKRFDFNFVISGAYGNKIMNRSLESTQNLDGVFNVTKDVAKRWRSEENPGDGVHPRAMIGTGLARLMNSRWVSDGSYATLKNVTLGYTFPTQNMLKYIKSIRLYSSIQQAFVLTAYEGSNPEVSANGDSALGQGIDWSAYPVPRTVSFGFNLNF